MQRKRAISSSLALAGLALMTAGCGGISASRTLSPASFLLPGLLQNHHQPSDSPVPAAEAAGTNLVAFPAPVVLPGAGRI